MENIIKYLNAELEERIDILWDDNGILWVDWREYDEEIINVVRSFLRQEI